MPAGLGSRFAIKPEMLPAVLRQIGFRVLPAAALGPEEQGPPAPPMLMPLRRRRPMPPEAVPPPRVGSGPFAVLAALRSGGAR